MKIGGSVATIWFEIFNFQINRRLTIKSKIFATCNFLTDQIQRVSLAYLTFADIF